MSLLSVKDGNLRLLVLFYENGVNRNKKVEIFLQLLTMKEVYKIKIVCKDVEIEPNACSVLKHFSQILVFVYKIIFI